MAVTWEREGVSAKVRKVEENTPFGKYANAAWAEWAKWAERARGGLWAKRPDRTSFQAESDKFWTGENRQVAKTDKFCSDEKWTSSVRLGRTGREVVGHGWAGKRIGEVAGPKSRKRISELKIGFLNLPSLGSLHKKI
jgi:hypothetical protein